MSFTNENDPFKVFNEHWIHLKGYYKADFGWKGVFETSNPTDRTIEEFLKVTFFSNAKFIVHFELFMDYKFDAEFTFIPLEVTPIKAKTTFTNPLAVARYQEELTGKFKASHEIKAGDFYVQWKQDMKVPKYSFYDYLFKDGPKPWPKDADTEYKYDDTVQFYKDPNSKNNLFKLYAPNAAITKQIGEKVFYKYDFIKQGQ